MGSLRPYSWQSHYLLLLFTCSGDCEAIEQYVLERVISIQLQKYKKT